MMTKEQIGKAINPDFPFVYAPTTAATKLLFVGGREIVGYFQPTPKSKLLEAENKYTFVEFGEKAQMYRATTDEKYITTVDGNELESVEYPSYSEVLLDQLRKIRNMHVHEHEVDWATKREQWKASLSHLFNTITEKWLYEYKENSLMYFNLIPTKRIEPNIGEYITMTLEIALAESKFIVLEPVGVVTAEYDGKLDIYMRGNVYKKFAIYRKVMEDGTDKWILAKTYSPADQFKLDRQLLESIISEWIQ